MPASSTQEDRAAIVAVNLVPNQLVTANFSGGEVAGKCRRMHVNTFARTECSAGGIFRGIHYATLACRCCRVDRDAISSSLRRRESASKTHGKNRKKKTRRLFVALKKVSHSSSIPACYPSPTNRIGLGRLSARRDWRGILMSLPPLLRMQWRSSSRENGSSFTIPSSLLPSKTKHITTGSGSVLWRMR